MIKHRGASVPATCFRPAGGGARLSAWVKALVLAGLAVALPGLLLTACAGGNPSVPDGRRVDVYGGSYQVISAAQLQSMMEHKDFLLVNVHVPYDGEIQGTDLFIPYDRIREAADELPAGKNTPIVVYCRSGHMSGIAARALAGMGYTSVRDLDGGMLMWQNQGHAIMRQTTQPAR